jgi:hypothetical protein
MQSENPYKAPQTTTPEAINTDGSPLATMERKPFKKLYYRSVNVGTIAFLLVIGAIAIIALVIYQSNLASKQGGFIIIPPIFYIQIGFSIIAAVGLFLRTIWGKMVGIIACILMLISIPIGTIIGITGLFALFKSPELFGPDRLTHKDLKKEYKTRKREKRF